MKETKRYLVINASPHKNSQSARFCQLFEEKLERHKSTRLNLYESDIPYSDGTYAVPKNRVLERMRDQVLSCQGMFISTPTYWFNAPAILKAFIEQLTPIEGQLWRRERLLGLAVHAPEGGELGVFQAIVPALNCMGFCLVGNGYVWKRGTKRSETWVEKDIAGIAHRFSV